MDLLILSGHTSGLGRQILRQAQLRQMAVLAIARGSMALTDEKFQECAIDLSVDSRWEASVERALGRWPKPWRRVILINNAGRVDPVAPLSELPLEDLTASMQLNALAPLRLMRLVLRTFPSTPIRIANISSGAAVKAYQGWALYCSGKAALRMLSEVAALEMKSAGRDVRVLSYAPGVVDTPMQELLRALPAELFPDVDRFKNLHSEGQLVSPEASAQELFTQILRDDLDYFAEYRFGEGAKSR